jgi:hypothetical protein
MDDFAYRYPYPTFVTPVGNLGFSYNPDWAGSYNQISVGNVDDSNYTHFTIPINYCSNGLTQTHNPVPINGGCIDGGTYPDCASDREMPYIVAPGWSPRGGVRIHAGSTDSCELYGVFLQNSCVNYEIQWGTSASAPTANAMVLNLIGQKSSLANMPELTRAIILATSRNVRDSYWNSTFDGFDGNGVIHGKEAIELAKGITSVYPGNAAVERGAWYSTLGQADFNGTAKSFKIKIPTTLPSGKHLRVVLTWDSSPDFVANVNDLSDLDLACAAANLSSASYDSNIETLDIPVTVTPAGSTLAIQVMPYTWRHHANARSASIYAAMVWTFVADHAH